MKSRFVEAENEKKEEMTGKREERKEKKESVKKRRNIVDIWKKVGGG